MYVRAYEWVSELCALGGNTSGETLVRYFERRGKKAVHFFPFLTEKEERQKKFHHKYMRAAHIHASHIQSFTTDLEHMKKNREKFRFFFFSPFSFFWYIHKISFLFFPFHIASSSFVLLVEILLSFSNDWTTLAWC